MKSAVIVAAKRTPIGSFLGSLANFSAPKLGSVAIEAAINQAKLKSDQVDEVIMGHVLQGGVGQAPSRQASLGAGVSKNTPCTTVNKVCGSGLKAVMMSAQAIMLGDAKTIVCGGMESMSNAPYVLPKARSGFRMGNQSAIDLMINDGLFDPYGQSHMGSFGDMCAREHKISRDEQDKFAIKSYEKAINAKEHGYFADEITPVKFSVKGESRSVNHDEELDRFRPEKFGKLKPVFDVDGTITAANASKINDGAAALVLMEEEEAKAQNQEILARVVAYGGYAHDPQWFTTAPVKAIKNTLEKVQMDVSQIDLFEINEAFSVVAMVAARELKIASEKLNVFGGAVALGHPIGCSGARVLVTLLNALKKMDKRFGLASLCLGGGEAVAMVVERI